MTGQTGICPINLGCLDKPFPKILEVRGHHNDFARRFENVKPLADCGNGNTERRSHIRLIEHLTVPAGQQRKETAKSYQVPHVGHRPDISLKIGLQIRGEPKPAKLRSSENFRESTMKEVYLAAFGDAQR
jgi:hypothetical protein